MKSYNKNIGHKLGRIRFTRIETIMITSRWTLLTPALVDLFVGQKHSG